MELNIILAGVGGQGILTTAQALSLAALRRGWQVKQAEVHGMSQRGGAVQSHLRIADHSIYSDLIPLGRADMILAMEPLEALRYVEYLADDGLIIANTAPIANIADYGEMDEILNRIAARPRHVLLNANALAGAAGSARSVNMIMLGAASIFTDLSPGDLEAAVTEMFTRAGPGVVETNLKALRVGIGASRMYYDRLRAGADPRMLREQLGKLPLSELLAGDGPAGPLETAVSDIGPKQLSAIQGILNDAKKERRAQLYEHEVYAIVELAGAISSPRHFGVVSGAEVTAEKLTALRSAKVVLKIISPDVVHKSDAAAVVFVPNDREQVAAEVDRLIAAQRAADAKIEGVLVVEFVAHDSAGFGGELFVGIRATREFGPVIAAGLGGIDTEYLAAKLKPGLAVAKALATQTSAEDFFKLFQKTAAYEILSGAARGHRRIVSDGELLRCFRAFIAIARRFCVDGDLARPHLAELEVNPFAFRQQVMIPLDGRGRLGSVAEPLVARPIEKVTSLLEPKSIAVVGVSGKRENFGRIILNNIKECGFPPEHLYVVKDGAALDGVCCIANLAEAPEPIDLLILAVNAKDAPNYIEAAIASCNVASVIVIPGGLGETEGTSGTQARISRAIVASRSRKDGGPIFLGGNCLGVRSRSGRYDTFFIQAKKLDPRRNVPARRVAILTQSGGFIVSRLSNLETLDPALAISIGNQVDLTASDLLAIVGRRGDIDAIGVYMEGFKDLDGVVFAQAVREVANAGKTVVFYKAGRTAAGRSATAGHTASIAGDYDVCQAAIDEAGAIVVDTFKEFEQVLELATYLHTKKVRGCRIGGLTNSGAEAVGMADATVGLRYRVETPNLSRATAAHLTDTLTRHKLHTLVNVRNPLDLTPMASDDVYEESIRILMDDDEIDAVVVSLVPLTPALRTTNDELDDPASLAHRLPRLFAEYDKPMIVVIDAGTTYESLAGRIRSAGVPVFRSCDQAIRSLGRYLCHRVGKARMDPVPSRRAARMESDRPRPPARIAEKGEIGVTNA
ncbi:MAG TPA: indolepyruvate oxidoreductase subunit beta [Phycisphaerae bacterium]|nr:indolepyruvate oxidoreductase subunit beta [Phycisphaerae bacterium]